MTVFLIQSLIEQEDKIYDNAYEYDKRDYIERDFLHHQRL